jgi:hypothetical protein
MPEDKYATDHSDEALTRLANLISTVGGADTGMQSRGANGLLLEHLEAARRNLLGARTGEYRSSLEQAKESVDFGISDKRLRSEIKGILASLEPPKQVY